MAVNRLFSSSFCRIGRSCSRLNKITRIHENKLLFVNHNFGFCSARTALDKESLKELRQISGAPLKDCKKALQETNGIVEDALDWLRIQGVATARKKSDQLAANGFIVTFVNENERDNCKYGSITEVNCVTDFVENNPIFQNAVTNIGNTILNSDNLQCNAYLKIDEISNSTNVIPYETENDQETKESQTLSEALTDIISSIRENLIIQRAYRMKASENGVIGSYVHSRKTANLGMKCSLVALETDSESAISPYENQETYAALKTLANNIAIHAVANQPQPSFISREEIPRETMEKEEKVLWEQIVSEGGSDNLEIAKKKLEGRLRKYYSEIALLDQPYCLEDDNKFTVQKLIDQTSKQLKGLNIRVSQMVIFNLGEHGKTDDDNDVMKAYLRSDDVLN